MTTGFCVGPTSHASHSWWTGRPLIELIVVFKYLNVTLNQLTVPLVLVLGSWTAWSLEQCAVVLSLQWELQ